MSEPQHPDPSQVNKWQTLYRANPGITNAQLMEFARDLGLEVIPPMSPSKIHGEWRSLSTWYVQDKHSGRDTSRATQAVFLRLSSRVG